MVNHPAWLTSSTLILLVLIKFILVVRFCFEAHFRPQNFSNVSGESFVKFHTLEAKILGKYESGFVEGWESIWTKRNHLEMLHR